MMNKCPKCGGEMEKGELLDRSYTISAALNWAKKAGSIFGIGAKDQRKITSYRCKKCGYLENYVEGD